MALETAKQSLLNPTGFRFEVRKLPNFNPNIQSAVIPGISLNSIPVPTPFSDIQLPSTRLSYGTLQLGFLIDEDMKTWEDIYDWMYGLGFPDDFSQYTNLRNTDPRNTEKTSGYISDANLSILKNSYNLNFRIEFKELFPTDLTQVSFDLTGNEETLSCQATFAFRTFKLRRDL